MKFYRPFTLISNSKLIVNCQRTAVLFVVFPYFTMCIQFHNNSCVCMYVYCEKMFLMKIFGDAIFPTNRSLCQIHTHIHAYEIYIGSILGWNFPCTTHIHTHIYRKSFEELYIHTVVIHTWKMNSFAHVKYVLRRVFWTNELLWNLKSYWSSCEMSSRWSDRNISMFAWSLWR